MDTKYQIPYAGTGAQPVLRRFRVHFAFFPTKGFSSTGLLDDIERVSVHYEVLSNLQGLLEGHHLFEC
jgi:DeoR/GlpR family transcriptional regulator of sugar metabolism